MYSLASAKSDVLPKHPLYHSEKNVSKLVEFGVA